MIRNFYFITGLAGGGNANLDGVATAASVLAVGLVILLSDIPGLNGSAGSLWQLQARTDATAAGLQRPLDFNAGTNAVVWTQIK